MNNYKLAKRFIKTFGLKRNYTLRDLTRILKKQGFSLYEYIPLSKKAELNFGKLGCTETASANYSFCVSSDNVKLCCIRKTLSEKEKELLLMHENLHIFMGDVKKDTVITPFQERKVTDLNFMIDFILKTRRHLRLLLAVAIAVIISISVYFFMNTSKKADIYYYVTPKGTHYHTETCDEVTQNTHAYKITELDAKKSYLPCSKCHPDKKLQ